MDHSINIYKDVITPELCDELIFLHKKQKIYTEKEVHSEGANVECYNLYLAHYPEHDEKSTKARVLSIIIALTDDYDGGVFNFPEQSYQVKLKRGEAITFPPNFFYPHEVSSPSNGERYTISLWVLINP